jgi:hypothetical protein
MIGIAFIYVLMGRITSDEAISLSVKFTYPRHWLKDGVKAESAAGDAPTDETAE